MGEMTDERVESLREAARHLSAWGTLDRAPMDVGRLILEAIDALTSARRERDQALALFLKLQVHMNEGCQP